MTTHANTCDAATTWVAWANTWKKHLLWFLRYTFLKHFLLYTSARAEPAHVDRFWRSIRHTTCFRPRMCLLGVSFILLPILGVKSPTTTIWGREWAFSSLTCKILKFALLSKLLHRLQPNFAQSQRPPSTLRGVVPTRAKQIQDGGRPPSWKSKIFYISRTVWSLASVR